MRVFDVDDVLRSVDRAVEAYGADYVDGVADAWQCKYTYEDGTHCLGGWVLKDWGLPIPSADAHDGQHRMGAGVLVRNLTEPDDDVQVSVNATRLLDFLQMKQDAGHSWGDVRSDVYSYADELLTDWKAA